MQSWRNLKRCRPWALLLPIIPPDWLKDGWRTMCRYLWMVLSALHIPQGSWYNSPSSHLCFNHWQWQMQSTGRECWRPFQAVNRLVVSAMFFLHMFYVCFGTGSLYIAFGVPLPQLEKQMQLELNTTWILLEYYLEVSSIWMGFSFKKTIHAIQLVPRWLSMTMETSTWILVWGQLLKDGLQTFQQFDSGSGYLAWPNDIMRFVLEIFHQQRYVAASQQHVAPFFKKRLLGGFSSRFDQFDR